METRTSLCVKTLAAAAAALFTTVVAAEGIEPKSAIKDAGRPVFVSTMISTTFTDSKRASQHGMGAALGVGTRLFDFLAVEGSAFVSRHKPDDVDLTGSDRHAVGYGGNLLLFPFGGKLANTYAVAGVHYTKNSDAPATSATGSTLVDYDGIAYDAGLGILAPINFLHIPAAFRVEVRYRAETFDDESVGSGGEDLFGDVVMNVGLLVPLFWKATPMPEAATEPAQVVAVADADSDGVVDDMDQCPDTPAGSTVEGGGCPAVAAAETPAAEAAPAVADAATPPPAEEAAAAEPAATPEAAPEAAPEPTADTTATPP